MFASMLLLLQSAQPVYEGADYVVILLLFGATAGAAVALVEWVIHRMRGGARASSPDRKPAGRPAASRGAATPGSPGH